jgi:hypothetical protein
MEKVVRNQRAVTRNSRKALDKELRVRTIQPRFKTSILLGGEEESYEEGMGL